MARTRRIPLAVWRRLTQTAAVLLFLYLFIRTDYTGSDTIEHAVNILFRIDPLIAAAVVLAEKTLVALVAPALITLVLTIVLGRAFCGWVCPMGALLDMVHRFMPKKLVNRPRLRNIKNGLLVVILVSAAFSLPLVGYFDPFSILVRGLTFSVYPAFNSAVTAPFTWLYHSAPRWVTDVSEPAYEFLRSTVLPFQEHLFALSLLSLAILAGVVFLERFERRFFCRNLCPLGAMLGLTSRIAMLRGHGGNDDCGGCHLCTKICRMNAIAPDRRIDPEACILCMDCVDSCPRQVITFRFSRPKTEPLPSGLNRRIFMKSALAGMVLPVFASVRPVKTHPHPLLIRPPGALPEPEFLNRCVRCGECMKVCIGNALHPAFLDAGLEGIFTPKLIARLGYCEYNCTLCGQVCPTGAIDVLSMKEKHETVIGKAFFDTNRCLPYARGISCIVCEEHCPTGDKAIKFRELETFTQDGRNTVIKHPYVVEQLCIGCGICETKCPLPGDAAIRVTSEGESRHPERIIEYGSESAYNDDAGYGGY